MEKHPEIIRAQSKEKMKWFLVFVFFQGQVPVFHTIMELPDALACEVAAEVYQTKSPEAERGWFWCWKLDQGATEQ